MNNCINIIANKGVDFCKSSVSLVDQKSIWNVDGVNINKNYSMDDERKSKLRSVTCVYSKAKTSYR